MPRARTRPADRRRTRSRFRSRARARSEIGGCTIGAYLVQRLHHYGVRHVFGIPGDYVLRFCHYLDDSPLQMVGTAKEDGAGFAADAYARVHGMGALYVTYCVGGLSVANAVAGAYAEKSPVVVISGAPGMGERVNDPLLHHKVKTFSTQKEIFERLTVAAVVLDDPQSAFLRIDEALRACWTLKRPVYIELPRDMVDVVPRLSYQPVRPVKQASQGAALTEAVAEAVAALSRAKRPVILADVEIHRYGLGDELAELVRSSGIPVAVTILGKSVIGETDPGFIGVYEGAMGPPDVRATVERSDCLLMLGTVLTDVNLGVFTAKLERERIIEATSEVIQVRHHRWEGVGLGDFLRALIRAPLPQRAVRRRPRKPPIAPAGEAAITAERLFQLINARLEAGLAVVCDVGLCLFGAIELVIPGKTEFLAPAYYTSMGFGIPGSIGLALADRSLRPVVLVGDGAFHMTGNEVSTIARLGLDPIIIVFNNHGYTTERFIDDGPFNDVHEWRFEKLPELLGAGWGAVAATERAFAEAWSEALRRRGAFSIINVQLGRLDAVPALRRLGEQMARNLGRTARR